MSRPVNMGVGQAGGAKRSIRGGTFAAGFTLVELITVLAIIVVLLSVALPSMQNFNLSGQFSQVRASLASLTTTAMIPSYEQKSGLLVMRARRHPALRPGPDPSPDYENPTLDHQEVRVVVRAPYTPNPLYAGAITPDDFRQLPFYRAADRTESTRLTELTWLAPDYATAVLADGMTPELNDAQFANQHLADPYAEMFPIGGPSHSDESLVNAFYVLFEEGECVQEPAGANGQNLAYSFVNNREDAYLGSGPNMVYNPEGMVTVNHASARGAYVYERNALIEISRNSLARTADDRRGYLREHGGMLYCTRFGGNLMPGPVGGR